MQKSVIGYDRLLPEVPGRRPWEKPESYLVKTPSTETGWSEETVGRRPSHLLLVPKIRNAVDAWRASGYLGASEVTRRLFEYWFEEDHQIEGFDSPLRYHFCQREAVETLAWLVEVSGTRDAQDLIRAFGTVPASLLSDGLSFQTTLDGKRQVRRYVPESEKELVQDLPPENLRRYALKMATGSGKTWVMAMVILWCRLHRQFVPGSELSTNFLIVAPNVIVYQRLAKDFEANRIFHQLSLIPPEWRGTFSQNVVLRGEIRQPEPSGNLFLTNIQQLYLSLDAEWTPANAVEALLGQRPAMNLAATEASMLERLKSLDSLVVLNDEAHHVHDDELQWSQSLLAIHEALPQGLTAWLDFSATPRDQRRAVFPWTVVDYPLAQAVEDRIVKAPLIVRQETGREEPVEEPTGSVTKRNAVEKWGQWLRAAVERWKEHRKVYARLGNIKPVLFIVAENNAQADALGEHLRTEPGFGFNEDEVLVIHTVASGAGKGNVRPGDLEKAREAARDIDEPSSPIQVIVSVLMLREGWDVKNVTVVLGLRPFTATAEILPEQVIGRGLRLMPSIGPDRTQTLEVLGTPRLLDVLREQLEARGVSVTTTKKPPSPPLVIEPVQERLDYDIKIPRTKPSLRHNQRRLADLDIGNSESILDGEDLDEAFRISLKMEFATLETEVHQVDMPGAAPPAEELLATTTNAAIRRARLTNRFAQLYPTVRDYVRGRCFGTEVDLDAENVRSHLARPEIREAIARYLARRIGELTVEHREIEFEGSDFCLSETKPFHWRRNLEAGPVQEEKTVFNFVATYNDFERDFAHFLGRAPDVLRFAALGTTEQGVSGAALRIDYVKPSGAIGFYYPDWVLVHQDHSGETNWVIETKGRVWEGTEEKDAAMTEWCRQVSAATGETWKYLRVNQPEFRPDFATFRQLVVALISERMFRERDRAPERTMTQEEVREARDEGRA
ncbi:MAG: hypothetical protein F4X59_10825 [Holophagales bacterium]|nr:hypothetical protein [Holophagales bacterium]MYC10613.1 hypothetical protein [Holophagales bacterium]